MVPTSNKLLGRAQLLGVALCGVLVGALSAAPHILIAKPYGLVSNQWPARTVHLPDFVALSQEFSPSLVHISTLNAQSGELSPTPDDAQAGLGSGIVIDRDGHIVTNYH